MWIAISLNNRSTIHASEPYYNRLYDTWNSGTKIDAPDGFFESIQKQTNLSLYKPSAILLDIVYKDGTISISDKINITV